MSLKMQPSWTDNVAVRTPYALLKGDSLIVTTGLDLRTKVGGFLRIGVGRYATGTLNVGIDVLVKRILTDPAAAAVHRYSAPWAQFTGGISYSNQLINNAAGYAAGVRSIAFDGQAASTAFAHGDPLCFLGLTAIPEASGAITFAAGVNMEFLRCSAGTATPFIPDAATSFAHADNEYFTAADAWTPLWLPGGSAYELVFDAGAVTTASGVFACMADLQTYDYTRQV